MRKWSVALWLARAGCIRDVPLVLGAEVSVLEGVDWVVLEVARALR